MDCTYCKEDEYHLKNINCCLRVLEECEVLIPKEKNEKKYLWDLFVDEHSDKLLRFEFFWVYFDESTNESNRLKNLHGK